MPYKYNPLEDDFDLIGKIPQYDADPSAPASEDAWVLRSSSGLAEAQFGLLPIMLSPNAVATDSYTFKFRTKEATTVSVNLT